jgi:hypothetical protein
VHEIQVTVKGEGSPGVTRRFFLSRGYSAELIDGDGQLTWIVASGPKPLSKDLINELALELWECNAELRSIKDLRVPSRRG